MLTLFANNLLPPTLEQRLGEQGEKEYRRLLRVARMAKGRFTLLPIESDLSSSYRTLFLNRLQEDLAEQGQFLRVITLKRDNWQLFALPEMETPINSNEVAMLIGLEETPNFESATRPPVFALLNSLRETLRNHIPASFFIWCSPYAYDALMLHAPDLFDHAAGIFHFLNHREVVVGNHIQESIQSRLGLSVGMTDEYTPSKTPELAQSSPPSPTMVAFDWNNLSQTTVGTTEQARAQIDLAGSLLSLNSGKQENHVKEALELLGAAIEFLNFKYGEFERVELARGLSLKGSGLYRLSTGDRDSNLRSAIKCYEDALEIYTEKMFPKDWALTQNNLGNAYFVLPSINREENLRSAIGCYESTLRVYSEQSFPQEWATTQNNLGIAYTYLPSGDHHANLLDAIRYFESALRVRTEFRYEQDWARTQINLGNANLFLHAGDRDANLRYAIRCYEAALRVFTKPAFPEDWAITQNNLGNAFSELPFGDRDTNLRTSVSCYIAALSVSTEQSDFKKWADLQINLGNVYLDLHDNDRAFEHFQNAVRACNSAVIPLDMKLKTYVQRKLKELSELG